MTLDRANNVFLRIIIPILALADGAVHLLLDFVLFRGRLIGSPFSAGAGRPGGSGPRPIPAAGPRLPLPLPLNEMFLLNFVGAAVLAILFVASRRWPQHRRILLDIVIIGYEGITFVAWWLFGRPNPMGLGYVSKGIEIIAVVAVAAHLWSMLRKRHVEGATLATGA